MSQGMSSIIMIVLMFGLLYFMMIRPEKKRKQQAQQMRDGLKKGDTITTIGGIIGKVVAIDKDTFVIETSDDRVRRCPPWASRPASSPRPRRSRRTRPRKRPPSLPRSPLRAPSPPLRLPARKSNLSLS